MKTTASHRDDKEIIPVLIKSPWAGEFTSQVSVATAIVSESSRQIIIRDPFWRTPLERKFKQSIREHTERQQAWTQCLEQAIKVIGPQLSSIDPKRHAPIVINIAGRDSAAFLSLAAKCLYPESFLINIHHPRLGESYYDLLALPPGEPSRKTTTEILQIGSIPNMVREDRMDQAKKLWAPILHSNGRKTFAIIVGGYTGVGKRTKPFTVTHGQELVRHVMQIYEQENCNLVLTTSRRTPSEVVSFLKSELGPVCSYSYFPPQESPNPYMGYMACADAFVVTADSMLMMSEAADTGKRVYGFYPDGTLSSEHEGFYTTLLESGNVTSLPAPIEYGPGRPIHAADHIAQAVFGMIKNGYRPRREICKILSGECAL